MKKIHAVVAVVMSAILALSLTACGTQAVTPEPAPQPTVEASAEVEPAPEPVKEPEVEASSEEPEMVEEPTEEPATEEATEEPEEAEEPEEVDPMEALMESNMGKYISDGEFDIEQFAGDAGASFWAVTSYSFALIYDDWFVQAGNGDSHPDIGYVTIGKWDESNPGRHNLCTYSYLFASGGDINISDEAKSINVPVECIIHLKDIVDFVDENGVDVAPDVSGTDFKPCDPMDETIQY
ncbi:hypothetical protein IJH16_00650 [Candidatus Saccharibacteria bacterium]|nr:hypothetical protein [Candidatus Saccharibacteria bacterium]MBQ3469472.1 hypothetical protein [Candidatus Saccharibacteria bacterium]